jgi:hypothetical protein
VKDPKLAPYALQQRLLTEADEVVRTELSIETLD